MLFECLVKTGKAGSPADTPNFGSTSLSSNHQNKSPAASNVSKASKIIDHHCVRDPNLVKASTLNSPIMNGFLIVL